MERQGFTMGGNNITLCGQEQKIGAKAPAFHAVKADLSDLNWEASGKVAVFIVVPSVDTPVCELETTRFNEEIGKLGDSVEAYTISMDLPFAQQRFCGAKGIENLTMLSDYKDRNFGETYGCYIKELGLLNRSIFVVDAEGTIQYIEYVKENTEHPDYDKALEAIQTLVK